MTSAWEIDWTRGITQSAPFRFMVMDENGVASTAFDFLWPAQLHSIWRIGLNEGWDSAK